MLDTVEIRDGGNARNAGLRIGLALSLITGRPLRVGGLVDDSPRPRPGLGPGGLTLAVAASAVSRGRLQAAAGTPELTLTPGGPPQPGDYHLDVAHLEPSSAPFSSILEMLILPLSMTGGTSGLILRGGSHVMGGPTSDEISKVLLPNWRALGLNANYREIAPGFFPGGGGEAEATVVDAGGALTHIRAEEPFQPREVGVEVLCSNLPVHLAEQAMQGALDRLSLHGLEGQGNLRRAKGGKGQALLVWAGDGRLRIGFSTLGKRGSRPEALALEAVEALTHFLKSQAGLPSALAARLLLTLACAKGISRFTVSGPPKPLQAAMKTINAFWPGTVRLSSPRDEALLEVKVIGRDWGRVL
ncbi:MAG: hypothetical protein KQI62_07640 [Deltaproteobacteria bacterium]|nr:hypothetical protein [Deltaproteobacteria bacterium]